MKNSFAILICTLFILFTTSCEKDSFAEINQENYEVDSRSSGAACTTCEAIDVSLTKLSSDGDCTTSLLTIELNDPDCNASTRHMVYLGEEVLTYFTTRILDIEIEYCETEEKVLKVMGYNPDEEKWNGVCFKASMTSNISSNISEALEMELTYNDLKVVQP